MMEPVTVIFERIQGRLIFSAFAFSWRSDPHHHEATERTEKFLHWECVCWRVGGVCVFFFVCFFFSHHCTLDVSLLFWVLFWSWSIFLSPQNMQRTDHAPLPDSSHFPHPDPKHSSFLKNQIFWNFFSSGICHENNLSFADKISASQTFFFPLSGQELNLFLFQAAGNKTELKQNQGSPYASSKYIPKELGVWRGVSSDGPSRHPLREGLLSAVIQWDIFTRWSQAKWSASGQTMSRHWNKGCLVVT